ncbi:helix-turn-helix domain-containing protein [Rhodococcus opacus]|uniref:helix-turn-helix domain-containing protein n=1 Tax=Rhodococcus opacus TaxID=37919 RepID=UPI00155A2112|nr:helix-turn-helix transcriptional regulator [Rhodococcus opacus]
MGKQRARTVLETRFGNRVRTERESRGWSQKELADRMNDRQPEDAVTRAHVTTIAKIEAGDRTVRLDEAVTLATVFEVSLDWLMGTEREEDLAYAVERLTGAAQRSGVDLEKVLDTLRTAEYDLARHNFEGFRSQVEQGVTSNTDGLPEDTLRALAMLLTSEKARQAITESVKITNTVVTLRHTDRDHLTQHLRTFSTQ